MKKMKNIYITSLVLVLSAISFSLNAQIVNEETGEYITKERFLKELDHDDDGSSSEPPDLQFGSLRFATPNWDRIQLAQADGLTTWFNRQYYNMKNEIANRFGKPYSNFEQARDDYFKHWEKPNVISDARGIKDKYDARIASKKAIKEECVRNLKLLELRRLEISIGNIDNTSYGAFNFNGTPIGEIRSLNELNTLWNQEFNAFGTNEFRLHNDRGVEQFLSRDIINGGMNSSANTFNFNFGILNELLPFQINHYNNIGNGLPYDKSWYRLNLMQMYLNNVTLPFSLDRNQNVQVNTTHFSTPARVENYANRNRRGGISVFDYGGYEDYLMGLMLHPNETDERAIDAAEYSAELQAEADRHEYLNNLLGSMAAVNGNNLLNPTQDKEILRTVYYFNDGVVDSDISFCGCRSSNLLVRNDYLNGNITEEQLFSIHGAETDFMIQNPNGSWREVTRLQFNLEIATFNQEAVREVLAWTPIGDLTEATYEIFDENYGMAAANIGLLFVPFDRIITASGQAARYVFRTGNKVVQFTAEQIWRMHPFGRGRLIEDILSKTRYKDYLNTADILTANGQPNYFWPYFDFIKGNKVISLKTTYATSGFGSILKNINDLATYVKNSATNGGVLINNVELHIAVPEGYNQSLLNGVVQQANAQGIIVRIFEFK